MLTNGAILIYKISHKLILNLIRIITRVNKRVESFKSLVCRLQDLVQQHLMTSIYSIHNHQKKVKQNPLLRFSYLAMLIFAVAIPIGSRKVFATGFDNTAQLYVDGQTLNIATNAKTVKEVIDASGVKLGEKDIVEPGLQTEITDGYKINIYRAVPVTIQDKGANVEIETAQKTAEAIANEAGLALNPEDRHEIVASDLSVDDLKPGITLKVDRADTVSLNLYGALSSQRTQSKTVREFIAEKNIKLQEGDSLVQSPDQAITEGSVIEVKNDSREVQVVDEEIPMPEEIVKDVNKDTSYKEVQSPGYAGQKRVTYEIKKVNGQEVSRVAIDQTIVKPALKQTTVVGARKIAPSENVSGSSQDWLRGAGIPESQWGYVDHIITHESHWNYTAQNRSSGAYGLCQALPGTKMASAGSDWRTNPITQLRWCSGYAGSRYGGWAGAYSFWLSKHWW